MKKTLLLILCIIYIGGVLRFTNINWDTFGGSHPDERNISWAVTRIHFFDQLNPKFFAYGGLPIYVYRALCEGVFAVTHNPKWISDWGYIAVVGRYVSVSLSTISIYLMYLAGAAYFTPVVGILGATLLAFSPWAVQQAHFDTTETMLVFFLLAMALVSRQLFRKLNRRSIIQLGCIWGLAMAAKTTSLLFGIIPLTALWFPHRIFRNFWKKLLCSILLLTVTALIFFVFSPYTVLDLRHFIESMTYESGVALGTLDVPYTLQFLHTPRYIFQIQTMLWQAGPLILFGIPGLLALAFMSVYRKKTYLTALFVFPLVYFGWVGSWYAKFNRYNVPFLPFVTLAAAWMCVVFIKRSRIPGIAFTTLLLCITIVWGLANWTVYLRPQTRITASEWIYTNVPRTAQLYTEAWNDGLPIEIQGMGTNDVFHRETLNIYDEDNETKRQYYADQLVRGDYIILTTRRMWATMPNLGDRYPLTKLFYERLLDGSLGYKEVERFTSYPQLFGLTINDDGAEESFQVFDHPTVLIFQNTARFSRDQYLTLLPL